MFSLSKLVNQIKATSPNLADVALQSNTAKQAGALYYSQQCFNPQPQRELEELTSEGQLMVNYLDLNLANEKEEKVINKSRRRRNPERAEASSEPESDGAAEQRLQRIKLLIKKMDEENPPVSVMMSNFKMQTENDRDNFTGKKVVADFNQANLKMSEFVY